MRQRDGKRRKDDRRGRGRPLFFFPPSPHCFSTWMRPPLQPVPRPAPGRAEDFTSTPPIRATKRHTVYAQRPTTRTRRWIPPATARARPPTVIEDVRAAGCDWLPFNDDWVSTAASLSSNRWFTVGPVVSYYSLSVNINFPLESGLLLRHFI